MLGSCGLVTASRIANAARAATADTAWARNWRRPDHVSASRWRPAAAAAAGRLPHVGEHQVLQADLGYRPGRVEDRAVGPDQQRALPVGAVVPAV